MRCESFEMALPPDSGANVCLAHFSARARFLRIRIDADGMVSLVIPESVSRSDAADFLHRQVPWIRRTLLSVRRRSASRKKNAGHGFPETVPLLYAGKTFRVEYDWQDRCWTGAKFDESRGILTFSGAVLNSKAVEEAFAALLKRTAQRLFPVRLQELADAQGFSFRSCGIRLQNRRWGSCTTKGDISLNGKLLFFPPELADYVMIHELCHLRQMNHSGAFWDEVAACLPDWKERRRELNRLSAQLPEAFSRLS